MIFGIKFLSLVALVAAQGLLGDNVITADGLTGYEGPIGIGPFEFNYRHSPDQKRRYSSSALYNMFHNN